MAIIDLDRYHLGFTEGDVRTLFSRLFLGSFIFNSIELILNILESIGKLLSIKLKTTQLFSSKMLMFGNKFNFSETQKVIISTKFSHRFATSVIRRILFLISWDIITFIVTMKLRKKIFFRIFWIFIFFFFQENNQKASSRLGAFQNIFSKKKSLTYSFRPSVGRKDFGRVI